MLGVRPSPKQLWLIKQQGFHVNSKTAEGQFFVFSANNASLFRAENNPCAETTSIFEREWVSKSHIVSLYRSEYNSHAGGDINFERDLVS